MRIDQEVLTTNIQKFLRDGWQTVRVVTSFPLPEIHVPFLECPRSW